MSRVDGTMYRETRCRSCGFKTKGTPVPTLAPGVVLAYCASCKKRMPSEDLGPAVVVPPGRTDLEEAAHDVVAAVAGAYGITPEELVPDVDAADEDRIQRAYREWRGTPDGLAVVAAIRRRAIELRRRGWRRYGIQALAEVARFDRSLTAGPDVAGYKVNNSHLSRLARDLMDEDPELASFFEVRELRAEGSR